MNDPASRVPEDLLAALRADLERPLPAGSRERVRARLGASLAALPSASSGEAPRGAPSSAASWLRPGRVLLLGAALGAALGGGGHALLGDRSEPAPRPPRIAVVAAPSVDSAPARDPEPSSTEPVRSASPVAPARLTSAPKARRAVALPSSAGPAPAPQAAPPDLAAEQALLDEARLAIRGGDATAALARLRAHRERFPETLFEEEREALVIKALLGTGAIESARERAERFRARFPRSALWPSIEAALAPIP